MTTTADSQRRELARRTNHGLEVALFWTKSSNRVTIEVADARLDDFIAFEVAGPDALDAFYHPYTYAFVGRPDARRAIAEAAAT
jgi:hypothetical protein